MIGVGVFVCVCECVTSDGKYPTSDNYCFNFEITIFYGKFNALYVSITN